MGRCDRFVDGGLKVWINVNGLDWIVGGKGIVLRSIPSIAAA
jgi:hypothetical protein